MKVLGTELLSLGSRRCAVCGRPLRGTALKLANGRIFCGSHAQEPRCSWCRMPVGPVNRAATLCSVCGRTAVNRGTDIVPVKEQLKGHMRQLGIVVVSATRIRLSDSTPVGSNDPHTLGLTTWSQGGQSTVKDAITIQVVRGLPLPQFRYVVSHEFAHAAMAGSTGVVSLGARLIEGFAEALAIVHLREVRDPGYEQIQSSMLSNPDPVYGEGARLVLPAVDRFGVLTVLNALRADRPKNVRLPRA